MPEKIKYISLEGWSANQQWLHDYIDLKDTDSIKSVGVSSDGKKLFFYKVVNPTAETTPSFEVEIPNPDLDPYVKKIMNAVAGHVAVVTADGSYKDGGVALTELAKSADVTREIAEKISQAAHMKKELVTTLPSPENADANTFYLIKIESATGKDKYEIWTKIGDELILIDDTSIDLSGYVDNATLATVTAQIKREAIEAATEAAAADATTKANQALADAKAYTDTKTAPLATKVGELDTAVGKLKTDMSTAQGTIITHGNRLTAVENGLNSIETATTEEALEIFNSIFYPTA